jgi:hypothetical protein
MRIPVRTCALAAVVAMAAAGCSAGSGPAGASGPVSPGATAPPSAASASAAPSTASAATPAALDTQWSYEPRLAAPLTATAGAADVTLGSLDQQGIEVTIPAGTFSEETEVTLADPTQAVSYAGEEMTGVGTPFELSVGDGSPVRLQQPVTVRMTFDPATLGEDFEYGSLRFGYLNGSEWEYVVPVVDTDSNVMSFTTSHLSLFGQVKATTDEQVKQYVTNAAVAAYAGKKAGELTDKAVEKLIDATLEKLKITDEGTRGKVINSILKDDEYGNMLKGIAQGDPAEFNQGFNILIGKKIAENVPASALSKALKGITSDFGTETVQKAAEAAGYLAEGQVSAAARILGEHLADQFLLTHVAKAAVATIEGQISSWKNAEVEAAYQAYRNGASSSVPWWGYQVEKSNFDDVWSQMGGAARQLELEAIAAQEKVRKDAGMPPLTDAEKEKLRTAVADDLKKQFEDRAVADAEIEKNAAELALVMKMYKEAGFLEKGTWGYDKGYELKERLDILAHFTDKLLADTGRAGVFDGTGHSDDGISIQELKTAAMGWFSAANPTEAKQRYADFLATTYGIVSYPPPEALNGKWGSSTMTITDFDLGPEPTGKASDSNVVAGCDLNDPAIYKQMKESLQKQKGKKSKASMAVKLGKDGTGTLVITDANGTRMSIPATYENGVLKAVKKDKGVSYTYEGTVSGEGRNVTLDGSFTLGLGGKGAYIGGDWTGKK